ncbi:MAG: hypothetical protein M1837_001297 [Sclerophora amabilis]|nr:MAG: hypothetical protein M1837_001297 [Sclerophora amabilis]
MVPALQASRDKLAKYYGATYNTNDQIYFIATILNPEHKLTLFEAASWEPCWKDFYRTQFENYFVTKYESGQRSPPVPLKEPGRVSLTNAAADELTLVVRNNRKRKSRLQNEQGEIAAYLEEGTIGSINPMIFWRRNGSRLPRTAEMARDILAVPAAGVGVERLFNLARNMISYCRERDSDLEFVEDGSLISDDEENPPTRRAAAASRAGVYTKPAVVIRTLLAESDQNQQKRASRILDQFAGTAQDKTHEEDEWT